MLVLDHDSSITLPSIDLARPFYDASLAALGAPKAYDRSEGLG
jgi:hypothetical protein